MEDRRYNILAACTTFRLPSSTSPFCRSPLYLLAQGNLAIANTRSTADLVESASDLAQLLERRAGTVLDAKDSGDGYPTPGTQELRNVFASKISGQSRKGYSYASPCGNMHVNRVCHLESGSPVGVVRDQARQETSLRNDIQAPSRIGV